MIFTFKNMKLFHLKQMFNLFCFPPTTYTPIKIVYYKGVCFVTFQVTF